MTDNTEDSEQGFVDTPDPYQARNGRREALGTALHLIDKTVDDAETLIRYAAQIDAYLEDGSIPGDEKKKESLSSTDAVLLAQLRNGGSPSIHG